jgi:hypothetical protein
MNSTPAAFSRSIQPLPICKLTPISPATVGLWPDVGYYPDCVVKLKNEGVVRNISVEMDFRRYDAFDELTKAAGWKSDCSCDPLRTNAPAPPEKFAPPKKSFATQSRQKLPRRPFAMEAVEGQKRRNRYVTV